MGDSIVFDTSVLIDHLRTNRHAERMATLAEDVAYSAVVLAELWRGAKSEYDKGFLTALECIGPILTPTEEDWLESGRIVACIRQRRGFEHSKLRDLHFDVLIALSAQSAGARLITSNRADFELIKEFAGFRLEIW